MNITKKAILILLFIFTVISCTPKKVEQAPSKQEKSEEEIFSQYRAKDSVDKNINQVYKVIERYGRQTKKHKSYSHYKGSVNSVVQNNIFYDTYVLEVNDRKDWFKITFNSAVAAAKDEKVKKIIEGTPLNSIDMLLTNSRSVKYLLSDTNGDGILDFAMPKNKKMATKMTIKDKMTLLDKMQTKYTRLLSIIKKSYKNIRK